MKLPSKITFAEDKLKKAFEKLKEGKTEDAQLYEFLTRAFKDLEENAFCGIRISKKLIPKEYKNQGIDNLWKYNLPNAWRLIYSVGKHELIVVSIVLEWLDHKNYGRKFGYKG
ncbi:MAG: type II toxin-antitoxin system RelE/ParE family toxin [Candidatus Diapherotrites archaeon]|uniref:Type II toxin-antitoxin system RelE/ParE family toxin n=1 Tax=Candidatus Iainarchaeum sp. TaxID=3101447 RepID=A0A938YSX3_9ARCH|nr:type II toxin-antitoxin system RelE/ParE family toxin [Candidatus Diapherotrites archaeon]